MRTGQHPIQRLVTCLAITLVSFAVAGCNANKEAVEFNDKLVKLRQHVDGPEDEFLSRLDRLAAATDQKTETIAALIRLLDAIRTTRDKLEEIPVLPSREARDLHTAIREYYVGLEKVYNEEVRDSIETMSAADTDNARAARVRNARRFIVAGYDRLNLVVELAQKRYFEANGMDWNRPRDSTEAR